MPRPCPCPHPRSAVEKGTQESLDLVCKDEAEFQIWTGTLATLIEGKTDLTQYLLAIQKRQLEAASRGEAGEGSARDAHKAVLKSKGHGGFKENEANDVYSFGWGQWGQNGTGLGDNMEACPVPKLLESLLGKHVVQIAQGWSHTAVLLESGEMLQYGNRVGTGLNEDYVFPTLTPLHGLSEKAVSALMRTCALRCAGCECAAEAKGAGGKERGARAQPGAGARDGPRIAALCAAWRVCVSGDAWPSTPLLNARSPSATLSPSLFLLRHRTSCRWRAARSTPRR